MLSRLQITMENWLVKLLFLLYINDLCNVSKALDFILFADDTKIFFSHNEPNQLMEIVNNELRKLSS